MRLNDILIVATTLLCRNDIYTFASDFRNEIWDDVAGQPRQPGFLEDMMQPRQPGFLEDMMQPRQPGFLEQMMQPSQPGFGEQTMQPSPRSFLDHMMMQQYQPVILEPVMQQQQPHLLGLEPVMQQQQPIPYVRPVRLVPAVVSATYNPPVLPSGPPTPSPSTELVEEKIYYNRDPLSPCPHGFLVGPKRYIPGKKPSFEDQCRVCPGKYICEHMKQTYRCKLCGGKGICQHGRDKYTCKDCKGPGICPHKIMRSQCRECLGGGVCEHMRLRTKCLVCCGGPKKTRNINDVKFRKKRVSSEVNSQESSSQSTEQVKKKIKKRNYKTRPCPFSRCPHGLLVGPARYIPGKKTTFEGQCKVCPGKYICEHLKQKYRCKLCK